MSAAASPAPRPPITTRPMDEATERAYVNSTARAQTASHLGARRCNWPVVMRLVDAVLERCIVTVAHFQGEEDAILGYVAWGADGSVEFLVLNKMLASSGAPPGQHSPPGWRLKGIRLAGDVLHALLPADVPLTMRRLSSGWVMEALGTAGYQPTITPRAV